MSRPLAKSRKARVMKSLKEKWVTSVTVEEAPTLFPPFSFVDCTLLSHFSFDDFVAIAFLDLARDLDSQI